MKNKTTVLLFVLVSSLLIASPALAAPAHQDAPPAALNITPLIEYTFGIFALSLSAWLFSKARALWMDYKPNNTYLRSLMDEIVEGAVNAAEQKFLKVDGAGKDKLHYALISIAAQCELYGLKFEVEAIEPMVEATVYRLGAQAKDLLNEE